MVQVAEVLIPVSVGQVLPVKVVMVAPELMPVMNQAAEVEGQMLLVAAALVVMAAMAVMVLLHLLVDLLLHMPAVEVEVLMLAALVGLAAPVEVEAVTEPHLLLLDLLELVTQVEVVGAGEVWPLIMAALVSQLFAMQIVMQPQQVPLDHQQ